MANFTVAAAWSLTASDQVSLSKTLANLGLNGKVLVDDVFAPGVLDLAPKLASIGKGRACLLIFDDISGFTISIDGAVQSTAKYDVFSIKQVSDVPIDLEIVSTVLSRVRVLAVGDPD